MPARSEIQAEITAAQDRVRRKYLKNLARHTGTDTILYASAFTSKRIPNLPSYVISVTIEDMQGFMAAVHGLKGPNLDLILHSPGGSLEAAEQIVKYLRAKFTRIRAFIPQNAMSAATMIACACDEIFMGKESALGPIDPQITLPGPNGPFTVAAYSVLQEFAFAQQSVANDPRVAPLWVSKIKDYPVGLLDLCQQTMMVSQERVATWLAQYMFKGEANAVQKGQEIGQWLGNASLHKTHGRPISISEALEKGLKVTPLENEQKLQDLVLSVYHATCITFETTGCVKIIENQNEKGWYVALAPGQMMVVPPPNRNHQSP